MLMFLSTGNQHNRWHEYWETIPDAEFDLVFNSTRVPYVSGENRDEGDVAIDDVMVYELSCR